VGSRTLSSAALPQSVENLVHVFADGCVVKVLEVFSYGFSRGRKNVFDLLIIEESEGIFDSIGIEVHVAFSC
jgi:hypothetical protein